MYAWKQAESPKYSDPRTTFHLPIHHLFGFCVSSIKIKNDIIVFPQHFWSICHFDFFSNGSLLISLQIPRNYQHETQLNEPVLPLRQRKSHLQESLGVGVNKERYHCERRGETVDDADISRRV